MRLSIRINHPGFRWNHFRNLRVQLDCPAPGKDIFLQEIAQCTGSAPGIEVIHVDVEVPQRKVGGRFSEKVLNQDVRQGWIGGQPFQEILHRLVVLVEFPQRVQQLECPGNQGFEDKLPVFLQIHKIGIVKFVQHPGIFRKLADDGGDLLNVRPVFRVQVHEDALIFLQIVHRADAEQLILNPKGNHIVQEIKLDSQFPQNRFDNPGIHKCPRTGIKGKAVAFKCPHQPANPVVFFQQGHVEVCPG